LEAAKRVVHGKPDHQDWLHAPSLLLVGFGYEILFKSALLAAECQRRRKTIHVAAQKSTTSGYLERAMEAG